jgi:hypothetical protein
VSHSRKPGIGETVANVEIRGNDSLSSSTTCLISPLPNDTERRPIWQFVIE